MATFKFQYAVKVLCTSNIPGTSQTTDSLAPGNYTTVVNIHNPSRQPVKIRKKVAVPGIGISEFFSEELKPDGVTRVTCRQIAGEFGLVFIHGVEGFLVVESAGSLDVTAVYTAWPRGGEVSSIDVEQIKERRISAD